jgi:hypothetical protein
MIVAEKLEGPVVTGEALLEELRRLFVVALDGRVEGQSLELHSP